MPHDYSTAPPPDEVNLSPDGTIATVVVNIRPGGVGEDQLLKRSQNGECELLECDIVVVDGPNARKKFREYQLIVGTTPEQKNMAEVYRARRKEMLQSARGIKDGDQSPQARAAYMADLKDFDGLTFVAKIGVEKGQPRKGGTGNYPSKNVIAAVIKPGAAEWHPVTQAPPFDGGGNSGVAAPSASPEASPGNPPITAPDWAR